MNKFILAFALLLWSNQAHAALAVDGSCANNSAAGTTLTCVLTTTNTNDIIVCTITDTATGTNYSTTTAVNDGSAYTKRNEVQYNGTGGAFPIGFVDSQIWWRYSATALTAVTITATFTAGSGATQTDNAMVCFGVNGFTGTSYQTNPWDQSAATALPWAATTNSTTASQPVSNTFSSVTASGMVVSYTSSSSTANWNGAGTIGGVTATHVNDSGTGSGGLGAQVAVDVLTFSSMRSSITTTPKAATAEGWAQIPDILATAGGGGGATQAPTRMLLGVGK